jgi:phosphatidylglycerophosphate synthase
MVRVGRAMQLAVPNGITALRLALVVAAGTQSLPPSEVVELIILAAVLDLLDGFAARCLSATTTAGALLDLVVDGFMWTACIHLGFMQGGHSRLAIFGWVVLTLEWACTLCLLHASLCGH